MVRRTYTLSLGEYIDKKQGGDKLRTAKRRERADELVSIDHILLADGRMNGLSDCLPAETAGSRRCRV